MKKILTRSTCMLAGLACLLIHQPVLAQMSQMDEDMKSERVMESVGTAAIDWSEGVVRVTGSGAPPDRGTLAQRRLMAERSATADAYRQLAEAINGIRVNSETIVRDYVVESDTIKTYVQALIKGAQKMDLRYMNDGSVEVDLAVKIYSSAGLNGILQPQKPVVPPPPVSLEADPKPGDYTGVIVDCRGLGVEAAMSPAIVSKDGGEVYLGNLPVNPEFVINHGIVGYTRTLAQARQNSRVGDHPLIIKGLSASGNFRTDVMIDDHDTEQLLGLEAQGKILSDAHVIFVL